MKQKIHRIRYILNNLAYFSFAKNSKEQRLALQEIIEEVDFIIKSLEGEYGEN